MSRADLPSRSPGEPARGSGPLPIGFRIGTRRIVAAVGSGTSGTVYRAVSNDGAVDALKVLHAQLGSTAAARERFRREAEIAASLHHPHLIAVHGHGQCPGLPGVDGPLLWTALELLEGGTAARLVPAGRAEPDVAAILAVLAQVAQGLDHAHAMDVIHRDVKPANILLSADPHPRAVVTDFGIARLLEDSRPLARNGRVLGSVPYAAPEVLQGLRLGPASDVYALGATAVEVLTGAPPYPRATTFGVVNAHLTSTPPRVSRRHRWVPAAVDRVVAHALAKDPRTRPETCAALVEEFAVAVASTSARRRPTSS